MQILLIEDNPVDALLVQEALSEVSAIVFEVSHALRLSEGLEQLGIHAFDVILLDLGLPDSRGIETMARLSKGARGTPVVVLTGLDDESVALSAVQAGAQDYLVKGSADSNSLSKAVRYAVERKGAERALRESEARVRLLLDSTAEAIYGIDVEGNCSFCNASCVRLLGYSTSSDLLGQNMRSLVHYARADKTPLPREDCKIERVLREGGIAHADDEVFWRADKRPIPVEYWAHPIREDGLIIGSVVTFLDISERKQLEEQYRHAQKLEGIGRLAGGVAHDFNNLLTVINGYGEMLATELPGDGPHKELAQEIVNAGERAAALTRQLLAFSRRQVLVPKPLDLNAVVTGMENMIRRLIGEDIHLLVAPGGDLWRVRADRGQIEQVIMNLVVNSRDAMPRGGRLTIEVDNAVLDESYLRAHVHAKPGAHVQISISDTGTGMDSATMARIFEPFFTSKGPEKGTGLGLATVYGIVNQSGGHIEVYSEVDVGTTFKVYLPREMAEGDVEEFFHVAPVKLDGTETLLLVEDEESVRRLARLVLEKHGYKVLEAECPDKALEVTAKFKEPISLMVTDVVMPKMSGRQLADRFAELRPEMLVLFISGYTDDAIIHHGVLESGTQFLQKPFPPETLARRVREMLDAKKSAAVK